MSIGCSFDGSWFRLALVLVLLVVSVCWGSGDASADGWVDRIEGDLAVILEEQGEGSDEWLERVVPVSDLPAGVREGDYIAGGAVDREVTVAMLKRIIELQRRLFTPKTD